MLQARLLLSLFLFGVLAGILSGVHGETTRSPHRPPSKKPPDTCVTNYFPRSRPEARRAGLEPMFQMTVDYINALVPYTLGELIHDYNIYTYEDFYSQAFLDQWKEWGMNYLGLAISLVLGVLFVVVMPFVAFFYCCCRSCGPRCCCGCCRTPDKGKTSKCKRVCCGTMLFVFTTMMLSAGVCIFLTQDDLVTEMGPEGFFDDVIVNMKALGGYVNDTMVEIEGKVIDGLTESCDEVISTMERLPETALEALNNATKATDLLQDLDTFVTSLAPLAANLSLISITTKTLRQSQSDLTSDLTASQTTLNSTLENCNTDECSDLQTKVFLLAPEADFEKVDTTFIDVAVDIINGTVDDGNIYDLVDNAKKSVLDISDKVHEETKDAIKEVKEKVNEALDTIQDTWADIEKELRDIDLPDKINTVEEVAETVEDYASTYYTYGYLSLFGLLVVIALFNYLGLGFGGCCSQPRSHGKKQTCTSKQGACFLLTSIALFLIFGWLLMMIVITYFVIGGGTEFGVCRHLVTYDESMQALERLVFNSTPALKNITLSVKDVIEDCKNDTALYTAFNVAENGFNITELLDLDQYGLREEVEKISNITVDVGNITIVSPELADLLNTIESALSLVNFDQYEEELEKNITKTDLYLFIHQLEDAAKLANDSVLKDEAQKLEAIMDTTYRAIEEARVNLTSYIEDATDIIDSFNITLLLKHLRDAEDSINKDASGIITSVASQTGSDILNELDTFAADTEYEVTHNIAGCRPVYCTLQSMTYAVCVYFLYPFNSMWWCLGWFLTCCLFTLIFGTKMAGYYRQVKPYGRAAVLPTPNGHWEMHEVAPDYDYDSDEDRPSKRVDHRHPGYKKPPKNRSYDNDPPPDYGAAMSQQANQAKCADKAAKKARKKANQV